MPQKTFTESRVVLVAMLLGLVGGAAQAAPIIMPPPEYDHVFQGRMIVESIPTEDVAKACAHRLGHLQFGQWYDACAWSFPDPLNPNQLACHELLPSDEPHDRVAKLIEHEAGHCAGWPADHPGGHYE